MAVWVAKVCEGHWRVTARWQNDWLNVALGKQPERKALRICGSRHNSEKGPLGGKLKPLGATSSNCHDAAYQENIHNICMYTYIYI